MRSFYIAILCLLASVSLAACSSRDETPTNQKAALKRPANTSSVVNSTTAVEPVNRENVAVTDAEVAPELEPLPERFPSRWIATAQKFPLMSSVEDWMTRLPVESFRSLIGGGRRETQASPVEHQRLRSLPGDQHHSHQRAQNSISTVNVRKQLPLNRGQHLIDQQRDNRNHQNDQVDVLAESTALEDED